MGRCCREVGSQCFQKNWRWASCHPTCYQNRDWDFATHSWVSTGNERRWDCSVLGYSGVTMGEAPLPSQQPIDITVHQTVTDGVKEGKLSLTAVVSQTVSVVSTVVSIRTAVSVVSVVGIGSGFGLSLGFPLPVSAVVSAVSQTVVSTIVSVTAVSVIAGMSIISIPGISGSIGLRLSPH